MAQYQGFPQISAPPVDSNGNWTLPWLRLLQNMWLQLGGSSIATTGRVLTTESAGGAPVAQVLGASPWTFSAGSVGTLVVGPGYRVGGRAASTSQIELSRDGVTWFLVGLGFATLPMMVGDQVRVSWSASTPVISFFPSGS